MTDKPKREAEFPPERVRDVSVAVYRQRLDNNGDDMIAQDGIAKVRDRAASYDSLTRCYLRAMRDMGIAPSDKGMEV